MNPSDPIDHLPIPESQSQQSLEQQGASHSLAHPGRQGEQPSFAACPLWLHCADQGWAAQDLSMAVQEQGKEANAYMKLSYLTEDEAKMPLDMALMQLALGLQTCKTKGEAVRLLLDAVELGRRSR